MDFDSKPTASLTIEELLEIARSDNSFNPNKVDGAKRLNEAVSVSLSLEEHIVDFIQNLDIKAGNTKVPKKLLYHLFKFYSKQHLTIHKFHNLISTFFRTTPKYVFLHRSVRKFTEQYKAQYTTNNKERVKTRVKRRLDSLKSWIQDKKMEKGNCFIECDILYFHYDKWCIDNRRRPIQYEIFSNSLHLFFPLKRTFKPFTLYMIGLKKEWIDENIGKTFVENWRKGRVRHKPRADKKFKSLISVNDGVYYDNYEENAEKYRQQEIEREISLSQERSKFTPKTRKN